MSGRAISVLRLTGAALLIGALGGWLAVGTPTIGGDASDLGAAPLGLAVPDPTEPRDVSAGNAADPAPDAAHEVAPAPEPSPFTTTPPRGAMDPTTWPTAVSIVSLGVDAPVQMVGVGTEGALIVPHSPMDVGWYQGGSVPGEPGVALLTSHVDTRTEGRGVFAGLVDLAEGDIVTIVTADGTEQRWTVTARTQHRKSELPPGLFARSGPPVLALVTCGGPFDPGSRTYRDNVIVWTERSS